VWIHNRENGIGEFRKLVVQFMANSACQKSERFYQPLDVWVSRPIRFELQPRSSGRVLPGELLREFADEVQLGLIVGVKFLAHVL
jgi:hypothetical protein